MATWQIGSAERMPVAQYLRMSTENQRYSLPYQREAIAAFVRERNMEIVKTYEDSGRSGLTLLGRPGLRELLDDVLAPGTPFQAVVVFDVSRWGRFQDVDESAYYEFMCRRAGVRVIYCAEPFNDNNSPMSVVIKGVKRAMAAEYSRELGAKVFAAQCLLLRQGFHVGGYVAFGLRRVMVSAEGEVKGVLGRRETKALQSDRVIVEPGDPLDVALVRHIFGLYVRKGMPERQIARVLNWSGYPGRTGLTPWTSDAVRGVLKNEQYVGNLIYNRRSYSLKAASVTNPPDRWIRAVHCFAGIVSQATFDEAQRLIRDRQTRHFWTREELLSIVKRVYRQHGRVVPKWLEGKGGVPSSTIYIKRFGSVADACEAAGIPLDEELKAARAITNTRRALRNEMIDGLASRFESIGIPFIWHPRTRQAQIEGGPRVTIRSTHVFHHQGVPTFWQLTPDRHINPDFSLIARIGINGSTVLDYFLLPRAETKNARVRLDGAVADAWLGKYRCLTLDDVARVLIEFRQRAGISQAMRLTNDLAKRRRQILGIKLNPDRPKGRPVDH